MFLPDCFCIEILILSLPLVREIVLMSLLVSLTVAISPNLITSPVGKVIGMFFISSIVLNSPTTRTDSF